MTFFLNECHIFSKEGKLFIFKPETLSLFEISSVRSLVLE